MVSIHELREDFRLFRYYHPEYRALFALLGFAFLLLKLTVAGAFLFACWYVAARGFNTDDFSLPLFRAESSVAVPANSDNRASEISAERVAILKRIAGQSSTHLVLTGSESGPETISNALPELEAESVANIDLASTESAGSSLSQSGISAITEEQIPVLSSLVVDEVYDGEPVSEGPVVRVASLSSIPDYNVIVEPTGTESDIVFNGDENSLWGYDWVVEQWRDNFTLQIALTVNRPFLVSFAKKLPPDLISAVYPERINEKGATQYSLVVGNFDDEQAAQAILEELPQSVRRYGAHVRRFGSIQDTVQILEPKIIQ